MDKVRYHRQPVKLVTSGVDWLTCTGKTADSRRGLWEIGQQLLDRCEGEGEHPTRWHGHGYDGWSATGVSIGARGDSVLLRLSGQEASNQWLHALRTSENCSRLDLAVDVYFELPVPEIARQLYTDSGHVPSRNGRPITRTIIRDSTGGQTCYLGRRVSDEMGRLYDKGVESAQDAPGTHWRYEVEYKREHAWFRAHAVAQAENETIAISSTVAQWFAARGGRIWPSLEVFAVRNCQPKEPSDDKKLHWLSSGVRPTCLALVDTLGYDRVLTALGLFRQEAPPAKRSSPQQEDTWQSHRAT